MRVVILLLVCGLVSPGCNPDAGPLGGLRVKDSPLSGGWMTKLPANKYMGGYFGEEVSVSGGVAVVGASGTKLASGGSGAAYIFNRSGAKWIDVGSISASVATDNYYFGMHVAIGGSSIIAGSLTSEAGAGSGSVYIFAKSGTSWKQQQKLTAANAAKADYFGHSVDIEGNTAVIGAPYRGTNGSVFVFGRSGTTWSQQVELTPKNAPTSAMMGYSISMDGNTLVAGAPYDKTNGVQSGAAYVFFRSGTTWTQQAKLTAITTPPKKRLGDAVSIHKDTVIMGAPLETWNGMASGTARIFVRSGTTWKLQATLKASDGVPDDHASLDSVAVYGDHALVGAYYKKIGGWSAGALYHWERNGTKWKETQKTLNYGTLSGNFGRSVDLDGKTALVGAFSRAYVIDLNKTPPPDAGPPDLSPDASPDMATDTTPDKTPPKDLAPDQPADKSTSPDGPSVHTSDSGCSVVPGGHEEAFWLLMLMLIAVRAKRRSSIPQPNAPAMNRSSRSNWICERSDAVPYRNQTPRR